MVIKKEEKYRSKIMNHLGLIAGMTKELEIANVIDSLIEQDMDKRTVSLGKAVEAMVLNGLGFVNTRLYLVTKFFENKPVERLLGPGIKAEHLNDDVLGRALDRIHEYGVSSLFPRIAANSCRILGLDSKFLHIDSTSFHVDGKYNSENPPLDEEGVIHITKGYSRDHHPELNQIVLSMIVENKAGLPVQMKPLNGNSSDQVDFGRLIHSHIDQLTNYHNVEYIVGDAALYTADNLNIFSEHPQVKWISRVPLTIKEAKNILECINHQKFIPIDDNYSYQEYESNYAGIDQRWVVVYSEAAYAREIKTLNKKVKKKIEKELKKFDKFCKLEFACEADALKAVAKFKKKCKYLEITNISCREVRKYQCKGRPKRDSVPPIVGYTIDGTVSSSLINYNKTRSSKGMFILASNELDKSILSSPDILIGYKNQGRVERGFRFLKDPSFLASSIFLEKPERVEALLFIMTLCLMVYSALEYRIRKELKVQGKYFPNQTKRDIQNPTAKWVFFCFVGVHEIIIENTEKIVANLKPSHKVILKILGPIYSDFYQ